MSEQTSNNEDTTPFLRMNDEDDDDQITPCKENVAFLSTFKTSSMLLGIILGVTFESLSWVSHISLLTGSAEQPDFWVDFGCTLYHLCFLPVLVLECIRHMFGSLVNLLSPPGSVDKVLCDQLFLHVQSRFAIGILLGVLIALLIVDVCLNLRHHLYIVGGVMASLLVFFGVEKHGIDEEFTMRLLATRPTSSKEDPTISVF